MPRFLVVANQTLGGEQLTAKLDELSTPEPPTLRLMVPVTDTEGFQQWDYPPIDRVLPDAHKLAHALAEGRLEHELARLRRTGVPASGEVVDADPVEHVKKALADEQYDGVVVSTLPHRLSRWQLMNLPHRITRASNVPVTQVVGAAGPSI